MTGEVVLRCEALAPTLAWFVDTLHFRVETIFPAEAPRVATLSGHGLRLRLAPGEGEAGHLRLPRANGPGERLIAPNGTRVDWFDPDPPIAIPPLEPAFVLTRRADHPDTDPGRAGMLYRDLIPGRLGGRFIASHITIPGGGPVADWVHYHRVRWQMIFCRRGWARLVYEDQGEPFVLAAGDFVLQPPRIRHRVLESGGDLEVVEIGCPALHETLADHAMTLPTGRSLPERDFDGQVFLRHRGEAAPWTPLGAGFEAQDSAMTAATRGLADVRLLRAPAGGALQAAAHADEMLFGFVLEGHARLDCLGTQALAATDAFVVPAGEAWSLSAEAGFCLMTARVGAPPPT